MPPLPIFPLANIIAIGHVFTRTQKAVSTSNGKSARVTHPELTFRGVVMVHRMHNGLVGVTASAVIHWSLRCDV